MESHIASKKLDAEQAKLVRARFETSVVKINQAVTGERRLPHRDQGRGQGSAPGGHFGRRLHGKRVKN